MDSKRYGVYWIDLNPVIGSEMAKIRPAVIVSDDLMNRYLKTVVVCPVASTLHPKWRSRVPFKCRGKNAEIAVDQIRAVSKKRIRDEIGQLTPKTSRILRAVIQEMYASA